MQVPWASALYLALASLLVLVLAFRVVAARRAAQVGIGSGGDALLERRMRVHGNAVENLPFAIVLLLVLELTGSPDWQIHALGVALLLGRVLHAVGLGARSGYSFGRFYGMALCWLAMLVAGLQLLGRSVLALLG